MKEVSHSDYRLWLGELKSKIKTKQIQAALSINQTIIELYWDLGKDIVEKQQSTEWGAKFIDQLSSDLRFEFPNIKGFSSRNLYAIRQWYLFYSMHSEFVPQLVAQIPWGHNRLIINKIKDIDIAFFYIETTIANGWGRDVLESQINSNFFERKGKSLNNFSKSLTKPQSDLAIQTIKDPYIFDFLGLEEDAQEREVEAELVHRIADFLLELGKGFAFVGRQYKIEISDKDYYIDMLFYHLELRCYVVIELKVVKFEPEFAGKLNFYLSAVDSLVKKPDDNPTIGILLCKTKDKIEAEFALRDINKPIGIADYKLTQILPDNFKTNLPTVEELEYRLGEKIKNK